LESEPMDRHASLAMTTIWFKRLGNGSNPVPGEQLGFRHRERSVAIQRSGESAPLAGRASLAMTS
jgi:hypothetical protein